MTENIDTDLALSYSKKVRKSLKKQKDVPHYDQVIKYDPVLNVYNPAKYLGSVSEKFQENWILMFPRIQPYLLNQKKKLNLLVRSLKRNLEL